MPSIPRIPKRFPALRALHVLLVLLVPFPEVRAGFLAGAAAVDITPESLPVKVNGGFLEASADKVHDRLHARAIVLDDGATRIAIAVVDSCMLPRELIDEAKRLVRERAGIPEDRILVSATHTHSAPSAMGCLGSAVDAGYVAALPAKIARAIALAASRLEPAKAGWTVVEAPEHTFCRRWIYRGDRMLDDPFGSRTVRANMHPGHENPDAIGPSGPVDAGLSLLSLQDGAGRPLALLSNFSMHYFGAEPLSADYCGAFCEEIAKLLGAEGRDPPFVAVMSQGTSGDQMWLDYGRPRRQVSLEEYASELARIAFAALAKVEHRDGLTLAMAEARLPLRRRVPDEARLAWANDLAARMAGRPPSAIPEVYALEQLMLHREPVRELKLQALRIGGLGIAAIPDEVFGITGLKLKAMSPLAPTFTIELANGSEGYIPPPEQHRLGGYTTWPARTAGLEVEAEPKILAAALGLLEEVAGTPRRRPAEPAGPYAAAVLASRPIAYWRLSDLSGTAPADAAAGGRGGAARLEGGVALYLPGPQARGFSGEAINRCVHLAGGRLRTGIDPRAEPYSVELWFWNGLPADPGEVTGWLVTRGGAEGLAVSGTKLSSGGRLRFTSGKAGGLGRTEIRPRTWHHVVLAREGARAAVYLDGRAEPEIAVEGPESAEGEVLIGAAGHGRNGLEGKVDEVAIYDRAVTAAEASGHFREADAR